MSLDHEAIKTELEKLAAENAGLIHPSDVVMRAREPDSPMHSWFEWDDSEAAEAYRLEQARRLLRVYVIELPRESLDPVRAFVSLTPDRVTGGGYRAIGSVLSDEERSKQLLMDALRELRAMQRRFDQVKELRPIFKAVDRVERKSNLTPPARKSA